MPLGLREEGRSWKAHRKETFRHQDKCFFGDGRKFTVGRNKEILPQLRQNIKETLVAV